MSAQPQTKPSVTPTVVPETKVTGNRQPDIPANVIAECFKAYPDTQVGHISQRMRALAAKGYKRGSISRAVGKSYQHVNNVLSQNAKQKAKAIAAKADEASTTLIKGKGNIPAPVTK